MQDAIRGAKLIHTMSGKTPFYLHNLNSNTHSLSFSSPFLSFLDMFLSLSQLSIFNQLGNLSKQGKCSLIILATVLLATIILKIFCSELTKQKLLLQHDFLSFLNFFACMFDDYLWKSHVYRTT